MERDLTVDHPIFYQDGLQQLLVHGMANGDTKKKSKGRKKRKRSSVSEHSTITDTSTSTEEWNRCWIEVLCQTTPRSSNDSVKVNNHDTSSSHRWIHIDPHREIIDKPRTVEFIDWDQSQTSNTKTSRGKKKRKPVSYVIAVEHSDILHQHEHISTGIDGVINEDSNEYIPTTTQLLLNTTRLTDVTPRYSNVWSHTLLQRGATSKELSKGNGKCANLFWDDSLLKTNNLFSSRRRRQRKAARRMGMKQPLSADSRKRDKSRSKKKNLASHSLLKDDSKTSSKFEDDTADMMGDRNNNAITLDDDHSSDDDVEAYNNNQYAASSNKAASKPSFIDEIDEFEREKQNEPIPTSKTAFKNHPYYIISSCLKHQEVLHPKAKQEICGMFKGELVYKRRHVSVALPAKKWLYEHRKVRDDELSKPVKKIKRRKVTKKKGFQALDTYGATAEEAEIFMNPTIIQH